MPEEIIQSSSFTEEIQTQKTHYQEQEQQATGFNVPFKTMLSVAQPTQQPIASSTNSIISFDGAHPVFNYPPTQPSIAVGPPSILGVYRTPEPIAITQTASTNVNDQIKLNAQMIETNPVDEFKGKASSREKTFEIPLRQSADELPGIEEAGNPINHLNGRKNNVDSVVVTIANPAIYSRGSERLLSHRPNPPKSHQYSYYEGNSPAYPQRLTSYSQYEALPRQYNTGQELEGIVTMLGVKKKKNPVDKEFFLGFLAGIWVVFAGLGSMVVAGGMPAEIRHDYPVIPKLITAFTFPVGLVFIMLFGGTLFTGNTMIMTVAYLNKKVSLVDLLLNWLISFVANLVTILLMTYLLGYQTGLFEAEPWSSYVQGIANKKMNLSIGQLILMGIPANALVCLALFLGYAARDVTGKILGLYLPIATFAFTGWEHCVADMFYLSLAGYYGGAVTVEKFVRVVMIVAIGNIIGGGVLVGFSEHYLYHWHRDREPTRHNGRKNWIFGRSVAKMDNVNADLNGEGKHDEAQRAISHHALERAHQDMEKALTNEGQLLVGSRSKDH